ncbi:MAG TPA: c-type cytochrome [Albitalea sp.]|nr:c-type cytochrome [Albitalea sp.]
MRTQAGSAPAGGLLPAMVLFATFSLAAGAAVPHKDRPGKVVVDAVCASCHATGKNNAPRIGDVRAWAVRSSQGLTALTEHAISGIRKMPAHGGNAGVSDVEIERAITYMVNRSGGHWVEPLRVAAPVAAKRSSETVVQAQCAKCHQAGQEGAPRIGDRAAWVPRMSQGLDQLVASAIHGHGAMPARGGLIDLNDDEIRGAIVYMFDYGLPAPTPLPPVVPDDPRHRIVSGTDVYLGLMSADAIRDARKGVINASAVKDDVPTGKGYYHVNISLADAKSHQPVTDAQVQVRVSDGLTNESKSLGPVAANHSVSYGNYFQFSSGNAYNITAQIRRPGVPGTIEARFEFKAP